MPVTPWYVPLAGGALIGAASGLLVARLGRVAGISGIVGALVEGPAGGEKAEAHEGRWRVAFLLGLVVAPWLFRALTGAAGDPASGSTDAVSSGMPSLPALAIGGMLVGFGTRLGSGCTSGHGVCGLARLSPRSLAAVLTFMATGFITVALLRHGGFA